MKSKLLFASFVLLFGLQSSAQRGWFNTDPGANPVHRNAGGTFALSLVVPGSGYMSNGMLKEGFIFLGIESLGGAFAIYSFTESYDEAAAYAAIGIGVVHLFQAVHATILTHKMNRKGGFASNQNRQPELRLMAHGTGATLSLRF